MDDEDEVRDLNLSSRPLREERRRRRDRKRLERGIVARSHHFADAQQDSSPSSRSSSPSAQRPARGNNGAVPVPGAVTDESLQAAKQRREADSR